MPPDSSTLPSLKATMSSQQLGALEEFVGMVLDLVRRKRIGSSKEVLFRLPCDYHWFEDNKAKREDTISILKERKGVIRTTDFKVLWLPQPASQYYSCS